FADKIFKVKEVDCDNESTSNLCLDITKDRSNYFKDLTLDLGGSYQLKNIPGVLQTAEILNESGFALNRKNIRRALNSVRKLTGFAGRWQTLGKNPIIIAHTGHN